MKTLKSVKLKQQDVSSEVLVASLDVKCNFTEQINANQGKMLNTLTALLEAGLETRHFKGFFSQKLVVRPHLKISGFL